MAERNRGSRMLASGLEIIKEEHKVGAQAAGKDGKKTKGQAQQQ